MKRYHLFSSKSNTQTVFVLDPAGQKACAERLENYGFCPAALNQKGEGTASLCALVPLIMPPKTQIIQSSEEDILGILTGKKRPGISVLLIPVEGRPYLMIREESVPGLSFELYYLAWRKARKAGWTAAKIPCSSTRG
jgi:hypothetical protein